MNHLQFDIRLRVTSLSGGLNLRHQTCPACTAPLTIHQPDMANPHRLLANCSCEECGVWFMLVSRPDEHVVYLVRIPSVIELVEAIARQAGSYLSLTPNGH